MEPLTRRRVATALLVACLVLWPLSHLAPLAWKQDLILALSWVALIVSFGSFVATTDVRVQQEDEDEPGGNSAFVPVDVAAPEGMPAVGGMPETDG